MNTNTDKTNENKKQSVANASVQMQGYNNLNANSVTNSPIGDKKNEIQRWANESPQVKKVAQLQSMIDNHFGQSQQNLSAKQARHIKPRMLNHTSLNLNNNNSQMPIQRVVIVGDESVKGGLYAFAPLIKNIAFGKEILEKLGDAKQLAVFQEKNSAVEQYRIGWSEDTKEITYTRVQDGSTINEHKVKSGGDGGQQQRAAAASARASSVNLDTIISKLSVDKSANARVYTHEDFLQEIGIKKDDDAALITYVGKKLREKPIQVNEFGDITMQLTNSGTVVLSQEGKIFHLGPGGK